ncbi:BatA domain-containing protein [Hymenobacter jeongseonensis]|uniref:BatA domain-containing protein n=1 Tax=Hymenobacter jeongseonensis TaxID=2791027 RepID=UPI001E33B0CB|nr:BatA domain-containing protein [Hymenobacter jeongseonensis]
MYFLYPWFLVCLVSVVIPVIIHLLQLRRPQRILFTNTSFIREVELVTVRHRKVQHLLVLVARTLTIAGLVLVFCQPFIAAESENATSNGMGSEILIDDSFSMQQPGPQAPLVREAISEAKKLGNSAPVGSKLRLLNIGNAFFSQEAFRDKLDEIDLKAQGIVSKVSEANGRENVNINRFVFSDYQKNSFDIKTIDKLATGRQLILAPVSAESSSNIYVDSVWLDDAFVRARINVGLHVRVRNGGSVVASDCPVKVFLGSRQVAAFRVNVEPGQAFASVVQVRLDDEKLVLGRVVVEDAPVTFDNTYYFTMQPAASIRVLEVGNTPVAQQLYGNEPLFTYAFSKPENLSFGVMQRADLVIVQEVERLDAGLRDGLKAVVQRGGSVVVVPPASVAAQNSYQTLFRELGLGTVQWEAKTATPELREVAMPSAREPFFRDVFGAQQRAATMPRVAPVLRWSRTGTDILRLRDGESYLANFTSGLGRVYVFSAPFAEEYSDFVQHALFVPVMYRLAMLSYRAEQLPAYRLTQPSLSLQLPATTGTGSSEEAGIRLVKDSLTLIPSQRVFGQQVRLDLPQGMDTPGFYQVQQRGKVLTTLAFNQDKRESELAAYTADELRRLVSGRPNVTVLESGENGAGLAKFSADQMGQPLWRYFLAFALVCLLAETLLIRFGNRAVARPVEKVVA